MLASALKALERDRLGGVTGELARHLDNVRLELKKGSVPDAIRWIDRAWRAMPGAAGVLAPIYARLMSLDDREPDAALRLLESIDVPDSDISALLSRTYLHLRRADDARRTLDSALKRFCVAADGLLAQAATQAMTRSDLQLPGWVGRGGSLEFIGELTVPPATPESVQVFLADERLAHPVRTEMRNGRITFSFHPPQGLPAASLRVCVRGVPLLGSGHRLQPDFALDGRALVDGSFILGWARLGWLPAHAVDLKFEDETGREHRVAAHRIARPGYRWPFRLNLRRAGFRGSRISIAGRLPDGRWAPLPDAPLLLARAVSNGLKRGRLSPWRASAPAASGRGSVSASGQKSTIDVVIPVYSNCAESLACIDSALATTVGRGRVVVIDDATAEAPLAAALDALAAAGRITLLRNEKNLGFVGSVNRALRMDSPNDIVLLNSDTLVFHDWLERLSAAAYGAPRVGTVTPLSNDGSIASYPRASGAPMDPDKASSLDELAASTNRRMSVEVPVGVGFCLYVRRDCLNAVGEFDTAVFGLGYGEEVDFCLRARAKNWTHRIAGDVFVYHASGSSFGTRKAALLERSQRLLNLRYPGYDRHIQTYLAVDPLRALRRRLDERRLASFDGRFVLLLTVALEGGVARFVAEREVEIREQGLVPLLLKPCKAGDSKNCVLSTEAVDAPNLQYQIPAELPALRALLGRLPIDRVEIQHFLHIDTKVVEAVRALNVPYEIIVHDYTWICPRVTLIDGTGRYCGEPAVSKCNSCVRRNGSRLAESVSVRGLRTRSAAWLGEARRVSAPSADTALRLRKYFPHLDVEVRPHRSTTPPTMPTSAALRGERLRVGLIGAIGGHKGYRVLLDCARDAARRRLPLEFVVIGFTENDKALQKTGKVSITGRYSEVEVPHLLRREQPDLVFLPSVWPETWCYALDHALEAALPVVSFDLGAIAERLREAEMGVLLPLSLTPGEINDRLLAHARVQGNLGTYVQTPEPALIDIDRIRGTMESNQMNSPVEESPRAESSKDEGLSASVQVLPLPVGLYLFSVKAATGSIERDSGKLSLPAMHVGIGPGTRAEHVEFLSGSNTEGAWLFASGDVLVAKVSGPGATLILTSVRSSSGDVLSIAVERLESRSLPDTATAAPAESAAPAPVEAPAAPEAPVAASLEPPPIPLASPDPDTLSIPLQVKTHIRTRGDMTFVDAPWAGRVAPGLWIESFSIQPLKQLRAQDIEYKGLTGTGFETPWLSEDQNCGTKGISVPLVGFAIRLKPGPAMAAYECEYSGYYRSGVTVGPLRNGAPCRSMVANDPLEGIRISIVKRSKPAAVSAKPTSEAQRAGVVAPSFGRYRDIEVAPGTGNLAASQRSAKVTMPKADKRIKPSVANGSAEQRSRPTQRSQNRNS